MPTSIPSGILIHPAIWPQRTYGPKIGGCAPFLGGGAGFPSNTMWLGLRPTYRMPSFILIHPTVWPQYTDVTGRQTEQDGTDIQWSDGIGRTVFTARRSYASAVLGVRSRNSVRLSVRLSHACFVTNPKNLPAIFLYRMKG